jgi:pimeloyl-ACP methyl ester carboxylesterase
VSAGAAAWLEDFRGDLARITVPVLVVQGAQDLFASRMGATSIEVPSSHVAMVSHPGEVAQLIESAAETRATTQA